MKERVTRYAGFERLAMRLLFAWLILQHIPGGLAFLELPAPNGIARFLGLSFLLDPGTFAVCRYLMYAAVLLYVLRIGWSVALPYLSLFSIAVGTIINSHGAISHYLQIVSLVLLAQTAAHFYSLFRARKAAAPDGISRREDLLVNWSQQAIAATYLVSALTKLIHTKGAWILQSPFIAVQIIKTTEQDYYDELHPAGLGAGLRIAEWITQHPLLVITIMTAGLLLELTAPLLLLGRAYALLYGLALVAFHETVGRVMRLHFNYNEYLIWIYLVNVPFWLWLGWRTMRERLQQNVPANQQQDRSTRSRRSSGDKARSRASSADS